MSGSQVTKKAKGTMGKAFWGHTMERWERHWQWTSYYKEIKGAGCAPGTEFWSNLQCGKVSPVCLSIGCRWYMWAFSGPLLLCPLPGLTVRATGNVLTRSERLILLEDFYHGLRPFSSMGSSPSTQQCRHSCTCNGLEPGDSLPSLFHSATMQNHPRTPGKKAIA